ncbi:cysteine dioxygenase [Paraburkholderia sp. EG287A]|uniref:cysteine dioxygenase family protein n=1 Tax=unclassified Paraburkholderia TaxID=2615204 RepID=UPI0034D25AA4
MEETPACFDRFVRDFTQLMDDYSGDETQILRQGRKLLADLVSRDDWLPERYAQPHPQYYQQYLLHADPADRFSVVSFVWGPGQKTPIHNHTVWALIGILRGGERAQSFEVGSPGLPMRSLGDEDLGPGTVESISPHTGDIHRVSNLYEDRVSISIHVYGGNIGRISRHVFEPTTSTPKPFISGYSNESEISA